MDTFLDPRGRIAAVPRQHCMRGATMLYKCAVHTTTYSVDDCHSNHI